MELFLTEKKPITDDDRIRLGTELGAVDQKLADVKSEKSAVAKVYGGRIRELEQKVEVLSRQLALGEVEEKIEVEEIPDDARMQISVMRTGTGELHAVREMNEAEKEAARKRSQLSLYDSEPHDTERPPAPKGKAAPRKGAAAKKNGAPKGNGKRAVR